RLSDRTEREVEEQRYDAECKGNDDLQTCLDAFERLILTTPAQPIAVRQLDRLRHTGLGVADVAADVPAPDVDRHLIVQVTALTANHWGARAKSNVRDLAERHLRAVAAADED